MTNTEGLIERLDHAARLLTDAGNDLALKYGAMTPLHDYDVAAKHVRQAAEAIRRLEGEVERLREYARAAADDYRALVGSLTKYAPGLLPKTIMDALGSASALERAASGDDIFAEYQSECTQLKARAEAAESRSNAYEKALREIADRLVDQHDEPWTLEQTYERIHYWRDKAITVANELRALSPTPNGGK